MNNINIGKRLCAAFLLMMLLTLILVVVGISRLVVTGETTRLITDRLHPQSQDSALLLFYATDMSRLVRDTIIISDPSQLSEIRQSYDEEKQRTGLVTQQMLPLITTDRGRQMFAEMEKKQNLFFTFMDEVMALSMQNKNDESRKLLFGNRYMTQLDYTTSLKALIQRQNVRMDIVSREATAERNNAVKLMVVITILVILLSIFLTWGITRSIVHPLNMVLNAAHRIAEGDLSMVVVTKGRDEMGRLLTSIRDMQDALIQTVSTVRNNAVAVASASAQIAQGNTDLSQRTEEQASALEQTAATMSELTVTVRNNADNTGQAFSLTTGVRDMAHQTSNLMDEITATMRTIGESSDRIAEITAVVDSIAFQTNILALNAAVEAARAGGQGLGFAVVAGEVRTLAQRSATAAGEIRQLITANSDSVNCGQYLASRAAGAMKQIESAVQQLTTTVADITAAGDEQARAIGQVGIAVTQMDSVTQNNAALVEESASAANSLHDQATQLLASVSAFRLTA
ncbi:methyl-accepting chemotaxis protein [Kosakonia sp. S42]|uniref:methyl-accepting chemotaxis protein n=1 Tax=Kosakonia sp. S42 TaxID=2767458 RepID=UPI00190D7BE9|nr:methyl-accepting chemotaxis protein [Kosakonia sp. S42]